jgi:hypothetical protein
LLALVEICGGARWLVHVLGAGFIVGRLAHAYSLANTPDATPARSIGVGLTLLAVVGASVTLLVLVARKVLA